MELNALCDNLGARKNKKVLGRGIGCGKGKTSGHGQKGQKSRSGVSIKGFEGGQMPLQRRLPKRGFKSLNPKDYAEMNVGLLQAAIDDGRIDAKKPVTEEFLLENNIVSKNKDGVRLLGKGTLTSKVEIAVAGATAGAIAAVEKAGGKVTLLREPHVKGLKKIAKEERAAAKGKKK